MNRRRTVITIWLFVFFSFLALQPVTAQEVSPTPQVVEQQVQSERPGSEAETRPRTVGDVLLGESLESGSQAKPTDSGSQKLDLPDRKAPEANWASKGEVGESTFFDRLIQVCWSLALISLLIWVSAKLAGKAGLRELGVGPGPRSMIEILERKRLSPGRSVLLMRVGPKVLAVAATEKGYETLTEFEGEQFKQYQDSLPESRKPDPEEPPPPEGVTKPSDILRHYLSIIPGTGAKK